MSTIIDEADALARMFKASFDATLLTTRHPGPEVARDGDTKPKTRTDVIMILSRTGSFCA